jgi:hypothetical protein
MMFLGCSFTWGQGLNYYSNLPSNIEPPAYTFDDDLLTAAQIKFIEKLRYPRLVADHFKTYEFVKDVNGGSNQNAIDYANTFFKQSKKINAVNALRFSHSNVKPHRLEYNEISHIIFQFTQPERDNIILSIEDKKIQAPLIEFLNVKRDFLDEYLNKQKITIDDLYEQIQTKSLQNVKTNLEFYESQGIKIIITTWPHTNLPYIMADSYLKSKLLPLEYKGQTYYSMHDLAGGDGRNSQVPRPELLITSDFDNFEVPPKDLHPSKLQHEVIAKSIIKYIENS